MKPNPDPYLVSLGVAERVAFSDDQNPERAGRDQASSIWAQALGLSMGSEQAEEFSQRIIRFLRVLVSIDRARVR